MVPPYWGDGRASPCCRCSDYVAWENYVTAGVTRYNADIHYWQVWNEPDLQSFWGGTPNQYAQMPAVAFQAIKRADFHHYGTPAKAAQQVSDIQGASQAAGATDRPIWVTEAGYPTDSDTNTTSVPADTASQVQWLADTLPSLLNLGVARVFRFELFVKGGEIAPTLGGTGM